MKEQGRPTLTLRRKAEPEGQRAVNSSEPDSAGPGRVTRKKTVVVNTTPAWKVRKQAVDESAKKAQADEKAARKAEKARQWAERQAQEREREAMRATRRKPAPEPVYRKVMPLADALALLEHCWPALVTDGQPQLLAVNIREAMVNDIRRRGLEVSVKTLKRCLAAVTRSDAYLGAMTVGAWRKNLAGEPVAPVSAEEAAYAVERRAQEHAKRQRRAVRSVATRARNELITTEKRKAQDEHE
ncbi:fertility inhibition protein FinO [Salmonella enterica]|uniref:fertility inhibition protein FinO n=1 Tax=Enterobacter sp. HK-058-C-ECC TaxID=3397227 RepID=UPI0012897E66|nr:fertility inhibition protein FinO [Salmonella enterica]EDU4623179.1 fertility inhibition protein FinO [Salmonella enterica subsp. enterica serovar Sandiego]EFT0343819.1 fertility inhibition protein FinO [Salmonella enterica subsp. enterica serovar Typhimurium]EAS6966211.1 fertility inhibition protein FinO [Salmonella enterica]EAV4781765.1 fertility inhibition protein FinO [Salmonella enterica]